MSITVGGTLTRRISTTNCARQKKLSGIARKLPQRRLQRSGQKLLGLASHTCWMARNCNGTRLVPTLLAWTMMPPVSIASETWTQPSMSQPPIAVLNFHTTNSLAFDRAFAELSPKNPLTSEQLRFLKDSASHSRDMLAANRQRIEHLEVVTYYCSYHSPHNSLVFHLHRLLLRLSQKWWPP